MATPESKIKAKLDRMLKSLGRDVWYFSPQAGPYGRAGIPDRIVCVNGFFFGIECKADAKARPTELQIKCMNEIADAGGRSFVVCDDASILHVKNLIELALKLPRAGSLQAA